MTRRYEVVAGIRRRDFFKLAAVAAASGVAGGGPLLAQQRGGRGGRAPREEVPLAPLGNGEPPAFQFQAYPGGTGALMEKLWAESGGNPFERVAHHGSWPMKFPGGS